MDTFKNSPLIIPVNKPVHLSSLQVVKVFKKNLGIGKIKIGHFGTLDPFASGVLLIGINGGAKLNDYVHEYCPKTYLAVGKLGFETESGDYTSEILKQDESEYLYSEISRFDLTFLNKIIREKFIGDYLQAPHKISAAKFQGRPLHEWTRAGVEVIKEPKLRKIYDLEVIKYQFPYLVFRSTVSSGTYIRTLFSEIANFLGTYGILISLTRERVGGIHLNDCLKKKYWPNLLENKPIDFNKFFKIDEVLKFKTIHFTSDEGLKYLQGQILEASNEIQTEQDVYLSPYRWAKIDEKIVGLCKIEEGFIKTAFNFPIEN